MKDIKFGWLTKEITSSMRDSWRNIGVPSGNDYYWIQYKNGRTVVYDNSYDEEKLPSLNISNILYISTWFAGERYGYAECFINPNLSHAAVQEIITNELYDEDGCDYYNNIEFFSNFPYGEFEF